VNDIRAGGCASKAQRTARVENDVALDAAARRIDADTVVREWLDSPGHCANIMAPQFKEMGVAFAAAPQSDQRIVWAQVFATPQRLGSRRPARHSPVPALSSS
jgi:uncharacterized protein YkwD